MNSIEDLRDYIIADTITQVGSLSREELVRTLVHILTTPLEEMDANELLEFKNEYFGKWTQISYVPRRPRQTT
jgi:sulfur transfer protein SufE